MDSSAADWAWMASRARHGLAALQWALHEISTSLCLTNDPGARNLGTEQALAHFACATAVARLLRALEHRRVPCWAARVMRLLPNLWHHHLRTAGSLYEQMIRAVCDGRDVMGCNSLVYMFFSHSAHYLGQTNLCRPYDASHSAQRVFEHFRGLMLPQCFAGWRPR